MPNKFPRPVQEWDTVPMNPLLQPGPANMSEIERVVATDHTVVPKKLMELLLLETEAPQS